MATTTPASQPGPLETAIREKLTAQFNPTVLRISNDSWQHRHHAAMRAQGSDGTGENSFLGPNRFSSISVKDNDATTSADLRRLKGRA
ncbi:Bola-like protein [Mycena venus]|uniref:Bola-like protein n=1 Tax=Mycena venus TaxID=2733690 RepID=A0A8H6YKU7_9AGAR|nr:Bola-like protein [Mycena venus]